MQFGLEDPVKNNTNKNSKRLIYKKSDFSRESVIKMYNNFQNTMIRIVTIPIEDFVYCLFMLGLTIWIYESQKESIKSKS